MEEAFTQLIGPSGLADWVSRRGSQKVFDVKQNMGCTLESLSAQVALEFQLAPVIAAKKACF